MIARLAARLRADRGGSTIVEFAIVTPVMMVVIMGLGDMLFQQYLQSVLTGAVQKAGRDSTIQGADTSAVDTKVITMLDTLLPTPSQSCPATAATSWCSTRSSYDTFSEVAPEPFTDTNGNGKCDNGEPYSDVNNNSQWDANPGASGQGGANAVALYSMTITYKRLFPVAGFLGWTSNATISASTLLKNQPYATQSTTPTVTRNCP